MAIISISVQYNGGFLLDIIMLTLYNGKGKGDSKGKCDQAAGEHRLEVTGPRRRAAVDSGRSGVGQESCRRHQTGRGRDRRSAWGGQEAGLSVSCCGAHARATEPYSLEWWQRR